VVEEDALRGVLYRLVEVRVVKDDVRALASELERHLFQVRLGRRLHDLSADGGGSGERDLVDAGVGREGVAHGGSVADDDVDDAGGDAGLLEQLGHVQGGERGELGRLDHDAAAGGEGRRDLPREHVQGLGVSAGVSAAAAAAATSRRASRPTYKVPGDDLTADTDRLVAGVGELLRGLLDDLAVDLVCPTTVVAEHGGGFSHLGGESAWHCVRVHAARPTSKDLATA
jgi:hypothetical protein